MNLDALANLGEFVGGIFVVVSLVYLAYQVRQNTESLKIENYTRVLERMSGLQSRLSLDPALSRVVTVGAESPGALTRAERIRFSWSLYELFGAGEFMYHQSLHDALPRQVWARWEASLGWWLSHPGIREWWRAKPAPLSADFEAFVEELIRRDRVDREAIGRWREFVAGEGLPGKGRGEDAGSGEGSRVGPSPRS